MSKTLDFSELLITKICHDLSAPIGAIYNGIEFIESEEAYNIKDNGAYELVANNAEVAVNKIKFFRYIYGKSNADSEVYIDHLQTIAKDFFISTKASIKFDNEESSAKYVQLTNRAGKLILVLATIVSSCMIHGGDITVYLRHLKERKFIVIEGVSEKNIKPDDELVSIINNHELKDIKLSNIVMHFASMLSAELGGSLHMLQQEKSMKFELEL